MRRPPVEVLELPTPDPSTRVSVGPLPDHRSQPISITIDDERGTRHVLGLPRLDNDQERAAFQAGGLLALMLQQLT